MSECHPAVVKLVAHLKASGTGKAKLEILTKLGKECNSEDDFLAKAKAALPEGTVKKMLDFIDGMIPPNEPVSHEPAAETVVEPVKLDEPVVEPEVEEPAKPSNPEPKKSKKK